MEEGIRKSIAEIVRTYDLALVSTVNLEKFPETRALDNCLNKKVGAELDMYFVCDADSPKVEQLKREANASLYYHGDCAEDGSWGNMTLFGQLEIVKDKTIKDKLWNDDFLKYWEGGKDDEQYCVLKFVPTGYKY
jgi:general stress protein 26